MKQKEIKKRFDEIVNFAEIEKFIETPVKHYSSGMYMRLAFAVAAHLEVNILLVDEVLAVGDISFQKKCLGKIGEISKQGKTILFVSHNMSMVIQLCQKGLFLKSGELNYQGKISDVISQYLLTSQSTRAKRLADSVQREGSGKIRFEEIEITNIEGVSWLFPDLPAIFKIKLKTNIEGLKSQNTIIAIGIDNRYGERLIELHTNFDKEYQNKNISFGKNFTIVCRTKNFPLKPGEYYLTLYLSYHNELCDRIKDFIKIEVRENDFFGTGYLPSRTQGWLLLYQKWNYEK